MKILRTDADRNKAMISRPAGGNVTILECCSYREVTIPDEETVRNATLVVILRWFRRRQDPVQCLRDKGGL